MIHFPTLEQAGLRLAVMSDRQDGDCSNREEARPAVMAFLQKIGVTSDRLVRPRQVHGIHIANARDILESREKERLPADGVITNMPDVPLAIGVADCTPVLLFAPGVNAVAALHAGREGTFQNIAAAGVHALCDEYGCPPETLHAVIGPCAGVCCYEVSPELARRWRDAGLPAQGRCLDLQAANSIQLENAGVIRHNIHVVPHCTVCGGLFFSYRAGEISNRTLVVVML